jgi:hypothetical protein
MFRYQETLEEMEKKTQKLIYELSTLKMILRKPFLYEKFKNAKFDDLMMLFGIDFRVIALIIFRKRKIK